MKKGRLGDLCRPQLTEERGVHTRLKPLCMVTMKHTNRIGQGLKPIMLNTDLIYLENKLTKRRIQNQDMPLLRRPLRKPLHLN